MLLYVDTAASSCVQLLYLAHSGWLKLAVGVQTSQHITALHVLNLVLYMQKQDAVAISKVTMMSQ